MDDERGIDFFCIDGLLFSLCLVINSIKKIRIYSEIVDKDGKMQIKKKLWAKLFRSKIGLSLTNPNPYQEYYSN